MEFPFKSQSNEWNNLKHTKNILFLMHTPLFSFSLSPPNVHFDRECVTVLLQVFADGEEPVKKPLDGIYMDPAKEATVNGYHSSSEFGSKMTLRGNVK